MSDPRPAPARVHADRQRAESFGAAAEAYDRLRPDYPAPLLDDLLAPDMHARQEMTALDVGCGTGKLARALLSRGVGVLGLEIDARMAEIARRSGVPVEVAAFERWDPAGRSFDLVVSGQAWHWIDPVVGPAVAASVLRPGGRLAALWNYGTPDAAATALLDQAYRAHAPELLTSSPLRAGGAATVAQVRADLAASGRFVEVRQRDHDWQQRYSAADYAGLIATHSDHRRLPPDRLDRLCAAVRTALKAVPGGVLVAYRTHLVVARRP